MTRLEREREAIRRGHDADTAFKLACTKLGLSFTTAGIAPLAVIALAETEIEEARRQSAGAVCGND